MIAFLNRFLNALERRFGSWAVQGLIRYLAIAFVAVYLLSWMVPNLGATLNFDWAKTLGGEVWRPFTFILAPSAGKPDPFGLLFAIFGMMFMFTFSDGLEAQWGVFRTNLYILWGWLSALLGSVAIALLTGETHPMPGMYLAMSVLFAFATYNPRFTIMLFMVVPVPIWMIAAFIGLGAAFSVLTGGLGGAFTLLCLSNYLMVAIPMRFSSGRQQRGSMARKQKYKANSLPESAAFNTCVVCGATEISHPDYDFRVGEDGKDYCQDHLPGG